MSFKRYKTKTGWLCAAERKYLPKSLESLDMINHHRQHYKTIKPPRKIIITTNPYDKSYWTYRLYHKLTNP